MKKINELRDEIDNIDDKILELIKERMELSVKISEEKNSTGKKVLDREREINIIQKLFSNNTNSVISNEQLASIYLQIFKVSKKIQENKITQKYLVYKSEPTHKSIITVGQEVIGDEFKYILGPCSIETEDQVEQVASYLSSKGLKFIRGGAFKPRTSPYDFQGLKEEGLQILRKTADKHSLYVVSEMMSADQKDLFEKYVDIIQVGARNMQNYELLKVLGSINKPILLKRSFGATIEEFLLAAEYIVANGNSNVILCERGIRTFENSTRATLDLGGIAVLRNTTHLPIIVDVSHSAGRRDIINQLTKAVKGMKLDGVMIEVHPNPFIALSDANQQITIEELDLILEEE